MNRQTLIETLANPSELPWDAISFCLKHPGLTQQMFIMLLQRAARRPETLDLLERRALYFGVHLLGALQVAAARKPLLALLCGDEQTTADILGDAIGSTVPRLLMALGTVAATELWQAVCTPDHDWIVRDAFLKAWTFEVLEGRIDKTAAEACLRTLPDRLALAPDDLFWLSWMTAIAHLGLSDLAEDVHVRITGGRIETGGHGVSAADLADFEDQLQDAIAANGSPVWRAEHGYAVFGPSFADFELANRTAPGKTSPRETPKLLAADRDFPFGDEAE